MEPVTLEEFLTGLDHQRSPEDGNTRLNVPEQHHTAACALQENGKLDHRITIRHGLLPHLRGDESSDRFDMRTGLRITRGYWVPGLDRRGLELYQTLRADGCSTSRARSLVESIDQTA